MAAKRLFGDDLDDTNPDQPNHKRMKAAPSFSSSRLAVNVLEDFSSALEPMLRRLVKEEVENGLRRFAFNLTKSPSQTIQTVESSPDLQLTFNKQLSLPIFTGTKITSVDKNPLQILLLSPSAASQTFIPAILPHPIRIQIVVLDGDFDNEKAWRNEDFDRSVVKERNGRRPLLAGETNVTIREGVGFVGDVEFTDNSSWIRSRKFRIGARVVGGGKSGEDGVISIRSAVTDAFVVKDHRGEVYKKHYPPALHDEVWRLVKIGKNGAFHRKLSEEGIHTVQDFLKLAVVDPPKLKKILGTGMSEKTWQAIMKHAWSCEKGSKIYIWRGSNYVIFLNPVCEFVNAVVDGQVISRDSPHRHTAYIRKLVKDAYENWSILEEVDAQVNDTALLTTGEIDEQPPNQCIQYSGFDL